MRVTPEQLANMQKKGAKIVERGKPLPQAVDMKNVHIRSGKTGDLPTHVLGDILGEKKKKPKMNKTERTYALQLQALKQCGRIVDYKFEPFKITLDAPEAKGAKKTTYTPDFLVITQFRFDNITKLTFEFHEVKGAHVWEDAIQKFKWARNQFPWFKWKMMQYKNNQWNEIYPA